jgi:hypothetical protein
MLHRRSLAIALSVLLVGSTWPVAAGAATPAAVFVTPTPGLVTVQPEPDFTATWTENAAAGISSRQIVLQASRPDGTPKCDPRWVPVKSTVPTTRSFAVTGLAPNRCYRFVLILATSAGRETFTSSTLIPAPDGYGATADFTNPISDVTSYEQKVAVNWIERDTLGSTITGRSLAWQSAAAVAGSCTGASWSAWAGLAFTAHTVVQTLAKSNCYRYRLTIQDAAGYRSQITSGTLLIAAALPDWTGTIDFYRPDAFATQVTNTVCVAASTQMMLNMIFGRSDNSASNQLIYIAYAQAHDSGRYTAGSDPAGWAATLDRFGGSTYAVAAYGDAASAIKQAALRMRLSNKPVGLLVWAGRHAWVMNGFSATADPATTANFQVTAVFVTGPLYPKAPNAAGYDLPPDTQLTPAQLAQYFLKYSDSSVKAWNGRYVVIMP